MLDSGLEAISQFCLYPLLAATLRSLSSFCISLPLIFLEAAKQRVNKRYVMPRPVTWLVSSSTKDRRTPSELLYTGSSAGVSQQRIGRALRELQLCEYCKDTLAVPMFLWGSLAARALPEH